MYGMQPNMMQMQMMNLNAGLGGMNFNTGPNYFFFSGTSLSLQSRLESMKDQEINQIVDASITVSGLELKAFNTTGYCCTIIWGSIIIFPLLFMCCGWWKKCVYPAFQIPASVYNSLGKLLQGANLRNITLNVMDNTFDSHKASILYEFISSSKVNGFTFINMAGPYNYNDREYSDFQRNMLPIKNLSRVMSDIRWNEGMIM